MKSRLVACLCISLVMSACASVNPPQQTSVSTTAPTSNLTQEPTTQGHIQDARLNEISGLAASNYRRDFLWALNDSGNAPQLYRLNTAAQLIDVWDLDVNNRDWEAMASVVINGTSYLLVAETGDNLQVHDESQVHIFLEPDVSASSSAPLKPVSTLRFQYEGGPRNVEAMGVDNNEIVFLTKERLVRGKSVASQIFSLPLTLQPSTQTLMARNVGSLRLPPRGFKIGILTRLLNIDPVQPTDMSISADGQHAYVLNYVQVLHYRKNANESCPSAFSKKPKVLYQHGLRQAEALTANALGEVWLTSEKNSPPLIGFKAFDPPIPFN